MISLGGTVCSYLEMQAAKTPKKRILGDSTGWLTLEEVYHKVSSAAVQLQLAGVQPGDRIALTACRDAETILMLWGVRMAGASAVLVSPYSDLQHVMDECTDPVPVAAVLRRSLPGCFLLQKGSDCFHILPHREISRTQFPIPPEDGNEVGYFIFTSGSTGKIKPVMLCDRNLIANLLDSQPLGCYRDDDIALAALPLDHVFGLVLAAGMAILGYGLWFPLNTDVDSLLSDIRSVGITRMNGVPSLYLAMAERCSDAGPASLRAGFVGGAPLTADQFRFIEDRLKMTLIPVYGMTECIGIACSNWTEPMEDRCGCVGKVYSLNEVCLLKPDGKKAAVGSEGEICVRGPARMLGYWPDRMPEDAFLHTGDLGRLLKSGHLVITGRIKELIIRNGKNISPRRIEDALLSLPGISAAAVVGLPDDKVGEVPCAMTVGVPDLAALRQLLPKNELPVGCMCVDSLPMTRSGKPDKQKILEVLTEWRNG